MSTNTIDAERTTTPEPGAPQTKASRKTAKEGQAREAGRYAPRSAAATKADRSNKKAEVIALHEARQRRNVGGDHGCLYRDLIQERTKEPNP